MPKYLLGSYWTADQPLVNLGDYLNVPVVAQFGCQLIDIRFVSTEDRARFPACVNGIGSSLAETWRQLAMGKRIVVWGLGTFAGHGLSPAILASQYDFRCVRGPLTQRVLGIAANLPVGDPALLLRKFAPLSIPVRKGILTIPHYENHPNRSLEARMTAEGADSFLNVLIERNAWPEAVQRIASAEFVLTSSLHGAIIAQAYDTPWALCLNEGENLNKPLKWEDWAAYLGIRIRPVKNYSEALAWWETEGQKGRLQSLDQIVESFPHDCGITED